ncbi:MAG: hypothetical protein NTZ09_12090 [Candidatus Hydrogenedentes bacterium]|nr:hypothetical protein [Candidatus Hydrogenedentota bacterium]
MHIRKLTKSGAAPAQSLVEVLDIITYLLNIFSTITRILQK